ncbi:tryptophan halogenase [Halosimplex carlsbadense 2-9-1]|uniref:Tryptophan halogenase n=1 Tax=Halosimplex carlsbadense 2-9-1 TaxID=797114 RepID=M0CMY6_9EURY|nr:tryptophan halogenase [Halosimplex carlsbadense 2-9-1]
MIAGGGDVGLLTALSLRKLAPGTTVRVVDDFQREVPQVGKSTYLDIQRVLHGALDIDEIRFVSEVKPVWKASVYFRDWCESPPFQYTFDSADSFTGPQAGDLAGRSQFYYEALAGNADYESRAGELVEQAKSPWYYGRNGDLAKYDKFAYHLTTKRFNPFLRELCRERGVRLVDDEIVAVETTGSHIDAVRGEREGYEADLYVDATGFNRVLRSEQDAAFRTFDFPLDRAFNARIERPLSEVVPATVIESGDHGWFWQIDTYDNRDLGYVYASEFADEAAAREEFREFVADVAPDGVDPSVSADEMDTYEFTSGYHDRAWVDNCIAIGNAEGFVEPLQSTALTANASLGLALGEQLGGNDRVVDDGVRSAYNERVRETWESIYDFVATHYVYASGETPFWRRASSIDVSDRLERIIDLFDERGFDPAVVENPGEDLSDLAVFQPWDFFVVMRKLGASSQVHENGSRRDDGTFRRGAERYYREMREEVEASHLTTEEFYVGVLQGR